MQQLSDIATLVDFTNLKPLSTTYDIDNLCVTAGLRKYKAVCVHSSFVPYIRSKYNDLRTCSVAGFPLGASSIDVKALEVATLLSLGVDEVDVVLNLRAIKERDSKYIANELLVLLVSAHQVCLNRNSVDAGSIVKFIIETGYFADEDIAFVSSFIKNFYLANRHKFDMVKEVFIKTCTGFGPRGVTMEDVRVIHEILGNNTDVGIKAAGGIKTMEQIKELVLCGATRIGTSTDIFKEEVDG